MLPKKRFPISRPRRSEHRLDLARKHGHAKGVSRSAAPAHLWDQEPSLWEAAQQVTLTRPVPPGDPQGERMWGVFGKGTAPTLSTQKLKITLWGPPDQLTLSLGKTDVWDRRIIAEPVMSVAKLKQIFALGEIPKPTYYPGWSAHDFPCPKPVGQLIFRCADLIGASQPEAMTHCHDGSTGVTLSRAGARARLTFLPLMTQNVIAVAAEYDGLTGPVAVRLYRHRDTCVNGRKHPGGNAFAPKPELDYDYRKDEPLASIEPPSSGQDGEYFWIRQVLPAEKTFPKGFAFVLMGRILDSAHRLETSDGEIGLGTAPSLNPLQQEHFDRKEGNWGSLPNYEEIRNAPGSAATATLPARESLRFTVLVTVVTQTEADDPLTEAKARLAAAARRGFAPLRAENAAWFKAHYDRREQGRIFRGGADFARAQVPEFYHSWRNQHHSSSCLPDPRCYEADTTYAWMEVDWANWHGIPCYNELFFTHAHVRNRSDRLSYFYNLLEFWWAACRQNARECLGTPGAAILHGYLPPIKPDRYYHSYTLWEFCMELPAQVLKVLWDRYDYGGGDDLLAREVYPKMRDVAECYRHYVTLGQDGYYHIIPTVVAEYYYPWSLDMRRNRDTTSALCLFRWQLRTTATAAERLGVDQELRIKWRAVAERLAPYPKFQTPEGPIFSDIPGWEENRVYTNPPLVENYNFYPGYYPCLLTDEVNLDSPAADRETMLRTARLVRGWVREQVPLLLAAVKTGGSLAAWNGYGNWDGSGKTVSFAEWSSLQEWTGMETEQDVFPESLLNSRSGRIHLFPGVAAGETIAFRDFQARGGFLVTAERMAGRTTFVQIRARRNETCRLMNPWPRKAVIICDETTGRPLRHRVDRCNGECLHFTARAGCCYAVRLAASP